jgi:hypothetical protein
MAINRKQYSIFHRWDNADFNNVNYTLVYASSDSNAILNGQEIFLVATTQLPFNVRSISADTNNVYLLGDKQDVAYGSTTLNNYPNP